MKITSLAAVFLFVVLGVCSPITKTDRQTDDSRVQLRAAIEAEEVEGDLRKAIELYREVTARSRTDPATASQAQLRIGMCYEKLGRSEALNAYQKVIENYPQQHEVVRAARLRIDHLAKASVAPPDSPKFRKIRIPANPENGVLSPNGQRLAFTSQGSVWVVPVHGNVQRGLAGEPVRLTEPMGARNSGNTMAWSGDGKWIAFNARENEKDAIFVVSPSGGKPIKIPVTIFRGPLAYNARLSLSQTGEMLVFSSSDIEHERSEPGKNDPHFLYIIPVRGGQPKRLTDHWAREPAFSPDSKRIAYTGIHISEGGEKKELRIIGADGSNPVKVIDPPDETGDIRGPQWSPDGRLIAFNYETDPGIQNSQIWIVPVSEHSAIAGTPTKIDLPLENLSMFAGWTQDNAIGVYLMNSLHQAVYSVPATGGKATQLSPDDPDGYPCYPKWSPDGGTVVFRWGKGNIVSVPSQGGELSTIHSGETNIVSGIPGGGNGVSPDGDRVVFMAYKADTRPYEVCIWTASVEGGELAQVTQTQSPAQDRYPCWSPDGKSIAFIRISQKSKDDHEMNIFVAPAKGGELRQITSARDNVRYSSIDWSPDGSLIAYFSTDNTIRVIPAQGGDSRVVANVERAHSHSDLSWSPDGKQLAFTSRGRLMVVPLDGGDPKEVETGVLKEGAQNFHIDWSPDGKKFVFTAGFGGDEELWLMEGFLPLTKRKGMD